MNNKEQEKNNTKTFSVRLDSWLYEKLLAASGPKGKNEYIRNLLIQNLNEQKKSNERAMKEQ
jgi:metal-responsive CopG/Arc/MetJ family transcriptional regulator